MATKDISVNDVFARVHYMDASELNALVNEIKIRRGYLSEQVRSKLRVGSRVKFNSRKRYRIGDGTITGVITKLNRKTAEVLASDNRRWKVSLTLLEAQ
jgi:hypothetical protein